MNKTITITWYGDEKVVKIDNDGYTYSLVGAEMTFAREPEIDHDAEGKAMDGFRRWKPGKRLGLSVAGTVVEEGR